MSKDKEPITMQNELLEALKSENKDEILRYVNSVYWNGMVGCNKFIADLDNLLLLQREHAADKANARMEWKGSGYLQHGFPLPKWIPTKTPVVDKESIINANILNYENSN